MRRLCSAALAFALALAAAGCGGGERKLAPPLTLPAAADTLVAPYADATSAVWLGGDRWAVLSPSSGVVGTADFAAGTIRPFASDSAAIRGPSILFRSGDTVYVGDWAQRRTTLWTLDGRLARAVPTTDVVRGSLPRGRDGDGRFYLELAPPPRRDGSGNRDSAAVLRATPDLGRADTAARLSPLDLAEVTGDAGRRFERRVFSGNDYWGALADGSVWVARPNQNRVDWVGPDGKTIKGQALPDRMLEVTRYDRELFVRRFPPELRATAEQLPFAPIKAPFEAALAGPDGHVWLQKSRAPADSVQHYHVVDRNGRLVRDVLLPGPGRIVGLGAGSALVTEPSREGARLLRIAVPAVADTASLLAEGVHRE